MRNTPDWAKLSASLPSLFLIAVEVRNTITATRFIERLIRPPFGVIDPEILVRWKDFLALAGILVCLLECGYPFFIWSSRTRKIWLFGVCAMHLVIGVTMGMYLFSLVMIVLNVAAFGPGLFRRKKQPVMLQPEAATS